MRARGGFFEMRKVVRVKEGMVASVGEVQREGISWFARI